MGNDVASNAPFFRRILFALLGLTLVTGVLAVTTTVEAMNAYPSACLFGCQEAASK